MRSRLSSLIPTLLPFEVRGGPRRHILDGKIGDKLTTKSFTGVERFGSSMKRKGRPSFFTFSRKVVVVESFFLFLKSRYAWLYPYGPSYIFIPLLLRVEMLETHPNDSYFTMFTLFNVFKKRKEPKTSQTFCSCDT